MILSKEKIHSGALLLVNARYPLVSAAGSFRGSFCGAPDGGMEKCLPGRSGEPDGGMEKHLPGRDGELAARAAEEADLVAADTRSPDILLKKEAANVLQYLLHKISAGSAIVPVSGYRSAKEQAMIYDSSRRENGEEFTRKYVALPGHSEHQTGLAIDLGLNQEEIDFIRPDFPYSGICDTFRRAAPNYGFIQRYTKEKEKITGISHEPWHFRYVGYPHSRIMAEQGLSLEEYTEWMKAYSPESPLVYRSTGRTALASADELVNVLYYVPADGGKTEIVIPENQLYQVSGNNVDGFVVTLWRNCHE